MAIWQYEIQLKQKLQESVSRIGDSHLDCEAGLKLPCPDADVIRWLDSRFPRLPSWSDCVITWGEENGHRVQAAQEDMKLVELTARVDLRQPGVEFVRQLISLARMCDADWVTVNGTILQPTLSAFKEAILKSPSYRFVSDPHGFLAEASEGR